MPRASKKCYTAADKAAAVDFYRVQSGQRRVEEIARAVGVPKSTLLRWVAEAAKAGEEGERGQSRIGRPVAHEFTLEESNALKQLRLKKGSLSNAVEAFLAHEACRPESGHFLRRILERAAVAESAPSWPTCLRRAAHLSEEVEAQFRGDRTGAKYAPTISRGAYWIDAQGNEIELMPHDIWESDDMSANEPFRHVDPYTGETRIGRQILFTGDRFSAAMLGLTLIGRDRDAYRAEDILDHLLDLIDAFGMPRLWRIERGVWESTAIDGIALDDARAKDLGYHGERWAGRRIGAIGDLFRVEHGYSSNFKGGIEGAFNHFQNLTAHESTHIGRTRGEFEGAARDLRRAQAGQTDAIERFWEAGEAASRYLEAVAQFNAQPKARTMFDGRHLVPNDLLRAHSLPKRTLPEGERWRFHPVKRLAVVQRGMITVTIERRTFTWEAFCEDIHLDHGHRVAVAFHPFHPERGCTIIEAEFGPRNREGRPIGMPLFVAMPIEERAQWDERPEGERTGGVHPAQRWRGQVRREFRSIAGASKSHLADGRGKSATIEHGFGEAAAERSQGQGEGTAAPSRRSTTPGTTTRSTTPAPDRDALAAQEQEALKYL